MLAQILNLLTTPPGNLVYHLVLAFSVITGLQSVVFGRHAQSRARARRMVTALVVVLISQLLLFLSSGLVWQGLADPHSFLPPLDRAITLLSLSWIAWLWIFPDPKRSADIGISLLNMLVVIFFLVTLVSWSSAPAAQSFNRSLYDSGWSLAALVLLFAALVLLIVRQPQNWALGVGFMLLNLAGFLAHWLLAPADEDLAGLIRLAQICTYPLLPSLSRRLHDEPHTRVVEETLPERKRYSAESRTVDAWLQLVTERQPDNVLTDLLRAIAQSMVADLCFLVSASPYGNELAVHGGYDLIREEPIHTHGLDQGRVPALVQALSRGKPIRLSPEPELPADLQAFAELMRLQNSGHLLAVPVKLNGSSWAGLVLLAPYSGRAWSSEDQSYLMSTTDLISEVLAQAGSQSAAGEEESHELNRLREEFNILQNDYYRLKQQRESSPQPQNNELVEQLQAEVRQLKAAVRLREMEAPTGDASQLESELRMTLEELAHLSNKLAQANMRVAELEQTVNSQPAPVIVPAATSNKSVVEESTESEVDEDNEVVTSIVQELRQPLSSIIGYTDLLLGESVGAVGPLQQKFLERIKTSSERMQILLADLLHMTTVRSNQNQSNPQPVDLGALIDQILGEMRSPLKEKRLALEVDLPEDLPAIYADPDALHQIITHLLQNAREVSPVDGSVSLSAQVESGDPAGDYILIRVTDSGGGIPQEDLSRVFTRIFRAEQALIPGIGDSVVGLSITKNLVEAQGGRIWVDSLADSGATFSVMLPTQPAVSSQ